MPWPRAVAIAATIGLHLSAGIAAWRGVQVVPRAEPRALLLFDVAQAAPTAEQPAVPEPAADVPPALIPVVVPSPVVPLPVVSPLVVAMLSAAAAEPGGACDLTGPVEAALRGSGAVATGLARVPRDARSVANAIMVWNAGWAPVGGRLDYRALDTVRATIVTTVAAASEACRAQPQAGPRLLTVPGVADSIVIALGSGEWRWQDLIDTAPPPVLAALAALPASARMDGT